MINGHESTVEKLPVMKMVDIVDLGSADTESVLAGISKAIDSLELTFEQLIHTDHDNPNLLMGHPLISVIKLVL